MTDRPTRRTGLGQVEVVPEHPRTRQELLKEVAQAVPHLLVLVLRLLRDPQVPLRCKLMVGAAGVYAVLPFDVLPDAIPIVGRVDDVVVLATAIHHLMAAVPDAQLAAYWEGSQDALDVVSGLMEWGADLMPGPIRRLVCQ